MRSVVRAAAALLAFLPFSGRAEIPVPPLTGPVVDEAGLLSGAEAGRLEGLARAARAEKGGQGPQLEYVIVRTTEGEPIEEFTIRVAEAWKIGNAGRGDGVIVAVAAEDRAVRIEVGNGIEGGLTDVQSSRIIRSSIVPAFRQGRYGAGLYDAGVQILGALGALPSGVAQSARPSRASPLLSVFLVLVVLFSILRGFFGFFFMRRRQWWGGGPFMGGGFGGFGGGGLGGGGGSWSGGGGGFSGGGASGRW